ncbi:lonely Cys domain-containing protein [Streptomyces globisporus]|nr:lonely Cys domain-containing protein [Streptomyces globisporus]
MRLDALRRAVTGSPLREGPFDLDAVTRYVLGLGEREAVTKEQRGELFRVALDENVEGARSLAAFRLVLDGVSCVARTLPRTGGSRGRNWTGGRIRELDTSQAVGVAQQPYGVPPLGEADPAPYVVLAAEGGHDHVVVLDGDGTPHRVTTEVFAELLALDPLLAGLPDGTPVVLLVPEAGARGLDLPRAVADRTGRTTWATSGRLRFTPQTEGGPAVVSPEHRPGETAGPGDSASRARCSTRPAHHDQAARARVNCSPEAASGRRRGPRGREVVCAGRRLRRAPPPASVPVHAQLSRGGEPGGAEHGEHAVELLLGLGEEACGVRLVEFQLAVGPAGLGGFDLGRGDVDADGACAERGDTSRLPPSIRKNPAT